VLHSALSHERERERERERRERERAREREARERARAREREARERERERESARARLDDSSSLLPRVVGIVHGPYKVDDPGLHRVQLHARNYPLFCQD
jgi:hypothetical protein